jgi:hypothetical protein
MKRYILIVAICVAALTGSASIASASKGGGSRGVGSRGGMAAGGQRGGSKGNLGRGSAAKGSKGSTGKGTKVSKGNTGKGSKGGSGRGRTQKGRAEKGHHFHPRLPSHLRHRCKARHYHFNRFWFSERFGCLVYTDLGADGVGCCCLYYWAAEFDCYLPIDCIDAYPPEAADECDCESENSN